jgi:hypothetical protein
MILPVKYVTHLKEREDDHPGRKYASVEIEFELRANDCESDI